MPQPRDEEIHECRQGRGTFPSHPDTFQHTKSPVRLVVRFYCSSRIQDQTEYRGNPAACGLENPTEERSIGARLNIVRQDSSHRLVSSLSCCC
jgi:hypothetical protein